MRSPTILLAAIALGVSASVAPPLLAQDSTPAIVRPAANDSIVLLVSRLELERYKATIKGLTRFGDRRQGTSRNRAAIDWIEAQLKSYGCTNTERIRYTYKYRTLRVRGDTTLRAPREPRPPAQPITPKGIRSRTGVNLDSLKQTNLELQHLNAEWDQPGLREEVYCTKIGKTRPGEMYILGAHMDGHGFGAAANDDGSGTALVMELARVFSSPDVETDVSIRFALWNNEETGLNGARAYVEQRKDLQGKENPVGSGRYPEPKWLGMIQHDMMMFDHGMPGPDGKMNPEQRREADVNIEFAGSSKFAAEAAQLAWHFRKANDRYATDYPANVGDRMSNTDSSPFMDLVAAISLRENERLRDIGTGWDPQWHQVTDVFETYSDNDFRLGLNAAQTTLAGVAQLAGLRLVAAAAPPGGASPALRQAQELDRDGKGAEARVIWQRLIDEAADPAARAAMQRRMAISWGFDGNCSNTVKYEEMVIAYWVTREAAEPQNAFFQEGEMANEAARVCIDAGDLAGAERMYLRGAQLGLKEPGNRTHPKSLWEFRTAHAKARLAARRGQKAEALRQVAAARKALDSDTAMAGPQERFYPYLAGYVALYTGDLATAEKELTRGLAIQANGNDPFQHFLLAETLTKAGKPAEARTEYQRAYDLATAHIAPAAFTRPAARKKLAAMGGSP